MDFHLFVLFLVTFTAAVALPGPNVIFAVAHIEARAQNRNSWRDRIWYWCGRSRSSRIVGCWDFYTG
ncbi:hypothetical protein [Paraburkholderia sp. EG304]|uniref:hypothetical protein n=1 Tax=Paraburkholderia sp. EG304 TaxID=3237015 RepID=UPI00397B7C22